MRRSHFVFFLGILVTFVAGGCGDVDAASERDANYVDCVTEAGFKPATSPADLTFAKADADAARLSNLYVTVIAGETGVEGDDGELSVTALGSGDEPDQYQLLVLNREDADALSMSGVVADPTMVAAVYFAHPAPEAVRSAAEACYA